MDGVMENYTDINSSAFSNATTSAIALTVAELWIQLIGFYFILGILSVVGYAVMAIGIIRSDNKNLRSRFFVILCALLMSRILVSLQMVTNFIYRTLRTFNLAPTYLNRAACYMTHVNANFSFTLEMVFLLILLADRMAAIIFFSYYRKLTARQAIITCVVAAVLTISFKLIPSFIGINFGDTVPCFNGYSGNGPAFNVYIQNIDLAIALLIFVMYIGLLAHLRSTVRSRISNADDNDKIAFKRQMKLLPVLRRLILIHCGFSFASKLLFGLANQFPDAIQQRFTAYGGMMQILDMFVNAVVLVVTNKELRDASFPFITSARVGSESAAGHGLQT